MSTKKKFISVTTFLSNEGMVLVNTVLEVSPERAAHWLRLGFVKEYQEPTPTKSAKKPRLKAENRETKPAKTQDLEQK
ncbi:hypothetical protein F1C16_05175 [Hymenobacter sp. NBH84]|uniref:hypothetical protein n=1 Tax=Hymenobacter sp. NBH84 TaxID=2596915 RepID=UPI0016293FBD|nr:hypothetical protein [Hymenobacter sp. NBH84]QNE38987.1 hypothetical protein F1C16_05175 [Hymenobacter sp. NBH84]